MGASQTPLLEQVTMHDVIIIIIYYYYNTLQQTEIDVWYYKIIQGYNEQNKGELVLTSALAGIEFYNDLDRVS